MRAGGQVEIIKIFFHLFKGNVSAHAGVEADVDSQRSDVVNFGLQNIAGQTVSGNTPAEHAACIFEFLKDRYLVASQSQVARSSEAGRATADHGNFFFACYRHGFCFGTGRVVGDESFQELDGQRFIHVAAAALGLAFVIADAAANRREGVGLK